MRTRTVTTFECDLCGKEYSTEHVETQLPSAELGTFAGSTAVFINTTYCDECVEYVRAARDRAIEERRALRQQEALAPARRVLGWNRNRSHPEP